MAPRVGKLSYNQKVSQAKVTIIIYLFISLLLLFFNDWVSLPVLRAVSDHVSLKIKQLFHVHSSSSSFMTFCVMATKSRFMTIQNTVLSLWAIINWQITAHNC